MTMPRLAVLAISAGLLTGCANKYDSLTPDLQASMMSDLRDGKLTLDCGLKCKLTWETQAPAIHALDVAERWPDLATHVMQIGYGSDLAYYYLGQSAQGLGYHQAAIGYYNYSAAISSGSDALLRCAAGQTPSGDPCQGVDLAQSIPVLVQASRDALDKQRADAEAQAAAETPAPVRRHRKKVASAPPPSGWETPPPPSASVQSAADASGWATPPAAK